MNFVVPSISFCCLQEGEAGRIHTENPCFPALSVQVE